MRIIVGESDIDFYTMANQIGIDYDSGFSVIDDMLSRGRIEVCNGTVYEAVCADGWNYTDASVVCRELGFSPYGTYPPSPSFLLLHMLIYRSHSFGK